MNKINYFDVLVVYTESLAVSAADALESNNTPFLLGSRNESYNVVYGYFLKVCEKYNVNAAFTTSADIVGAGSASSFWTFCNKKWVKTKALCFSNLIFDKFSPTRRGIKSRRKLLFSSEDVKSFNDPVLFGLFFDKQKTYEKLYDYSIPTISVIDGSIQSIKKACTELSQLMKHYPGTLDFSDDIIMKDRFGAGGRHIYKFKINQSERMRSVFQKNTKISFIIQPFAKFEKGFCYHDLPASTDIRIIYLNGKIVQSYIRVAKSGDFRCNEHRGGSLTYLSPREIPKELIKKSNLIAELLNNKSSLFALDFIVSNNGNIYLLEGNTGPGLDWNMSLKKNEVEAKKLIRLIVKELSVRVSQEVVNESNNKTLDLILDISPIGYSVII